MIAFVDEHRAVYGVEPMRAMGWLTPSAAGRSACNGAWRYEFYGVYDLPRTVEALNPILDSFQHLYNHHRPHGALDGLTPARTSPSFRPQRPRRLTCADPGQRVDFQAPRRHIARFARPGSGLGRVLHDG